MNNEVSAPGSSKFFGIPIPEKARTLFDNPVFVSLLVGVSVSIAVILIRSAGALEQIELSAYDFHFRFATAAPPDPRIVMIGVTEKDIQEQRQWPLSDGVMVKMLKRLLKLEPRVVGIDIFRDIPVPPGHKRFSSFLKANKQVFGVMKFGGGNSRFVKPPAALRETERVGFNDIIVDPGGTVRRGLLFLDDGKKVYYSFPLKLALFYLQQEEIIPAPDEDQPEFLKIGKTTFVPFRSNDGAYIDADDHGYQTLLDYKGGPFPIFTLGDILKNKVDKKLIKDKIVIIGVHAESVHDVFHTPLSSAKNVGGLYGVAMHAYMTSQFLRAAIEGDEPIKSVGDLASWMLIIMWGLIGGALGHFVRSPWRFTLLALIGSSTVWVMAHYAFVGGMWLPTISPIMSWLAAAALVTAYMSNQEKADRALLMQLFSKHVSSDVAKDVWRQRSHFLEGGRPKPQKLTTTVLFTDLQGFTSISEELEPDTLINWLNEYMSVMTRIVIAHDGVVNKYIGDAIMAVFGAPLARESEDEIKRDAVNAVNCALQMDEELCKLNETWEQEGLPTSNMRIGIFSGPLIAGSIGGSDRMEYTVIGDTVNIASRLESFQKETAGFKSGVRCSRILIGEPTLRLIGDDFEVKKVGDVDIKGKKDEITVYLVTGRKNELESEPVSDASR